MTDTRIRIAGVELKNPVMTASGTFGSGEEYSEFVDLNQCRGREIPLRESRKSMVECSMPLDCKTQE